MTEPDQLLADALRTFQDGLTNVNPRVRDGGLGAMAALAVAHLDRIATALEKLATVMDQLPPPSAPATVAEAPEEPTCAPWPECPHKACLTPGSCASQASCQNMHAVVCRRPEGCTTVRKCILEYHGECQADR